MDPRCLQHQLTPDEHAAFERDGYLALPGALNAEQLGKLTATLDRIDAEQRPPQLANKLMSISDILHLDDAFIDLIDLATTFPKVWGILGWNIYLYHSHLDVTPPADPATTTWDVAWHQDSMRVNDEIETHPRPRLSLKIGFYLTDVSQPGRGNTLIVPGSHQRDEIDCPDDGFSNPEGAQPLCVSAGTAVLVDRRVWHSRSSNTWDQTRKVIWLGYAYRWLRPKDAMTVDHLYDQLDPIQRQILGDGLSANGVYDPVDGDVPLRGWLEQHLPRDAAWSRHPRPQAKPPAMVRGHNVGRQ